MKLSVSTKRQLAIYLSKLKGFTNPKIRDEQYTTESNIAANLLWNAFMEGDIENKIVADYGAGTGILGIGAMLLGARKTIFIEKDHEAINILEENLNNLSKSFDVDIDNDFEIHNKNIEFDELPKTDTVIMNPPFGTKQKHIDRTFLSRAINHSKNIYSIHKSTSINFLEAFSKDNNLNIRIIEKTYFPIKKTLKIHKKELYKTKIIIVKISKKED